MVQKEKIGTAAEQKIVHHPAMLGAEAATYAQRPNKLSAEEQQALLDRLVEQIILLNNIEDGLRI